MDRTTEARIQCGDCHRFYIDDIPHGEPIPQVGICNRCRQQRERERPFGVKILVFVNKHWWRLLVAALGISFLILFWRSLQRFYG